MYQAAEYQPYRSRFGAVSLYALRALLSGTTFPDLFHHTPPVQFQLQYRVLCVGFDGPEPFLRSLSFFWYVVHNQIQTLLVSFDLFKLMILRFTCPLQFEQSLFALPPLAVCIIRCSLYSFAV